MAPFQELRSYLLYYTVVWTFHERFHVHCALGTDSGIFQNYWPHYKGRFINLWNTLTTLFCMNVVTPFTYQCHAFAILLTFVIVRLFFLFCALAQNAHAFFTSFVNLRVVNFFAHKCQAIRCVQLNRKWKYSLPFCGQVSWHLGLLHIYPQLQLFWLLFWTHQLCKFRNLLAFYHLAC